MERKDDRKSERISIPRVRNTEERKQEAQIKNRIKKTAAVMGQV